MTRGLSLPILGIGAAAVKMASDFQGSMSKIVGLVGVSREQVDEWSKQILDMSKDLPQTATELADAMFFITSAGLRGERAMDALNQAARASAAGLGETKVVADAVTSVMNAYAKQGTTAAEATDVLVAAIREGKLEAESLTPVLGRVIPTASALGIGFEQVAGVLAVFSKTGQDATEGATSLTAIMSTLIKPTTEAEAALASVGLSMEDLRNMAAQPGGLIQVMRTLDDRFAGNVEAMGAVVPNVRAFRGIMNALAQDAESVDSVMLGVANATGSTDKAFEEAAQTAEFKLKSAVSSLQASLIELGLAIIPVVVPAVQGLVAILGKLSKAFTILPAPIRKFVAGSLLFLAILGPTVLLVGKIIKGLGALASAYTFLKGTTLGAAAAQRTFAVAARVATLAMAATPVGLLVAALVALAAVFVLLVKRSETFRLGLKITFEKAKAIVQGFVGFFTQTVPRAFQRVVDFMRETGAKIVGFIRELPSKVLTLAKDIGRKIVQGIIDGIAGLPGALKDKIGSALGSVLGGIDIPGFSPPQQAAEKAIGRPLAFGVETGWIMGTRDLPNKMADTVRDALDKAQSAVNARRDSFASSFTGLTSKVNEVFDEATRSRMTKSEREIAAIEARRQKEDQLLAVRDARQRLAEAKEEGNRQAIADAERGLARALEDIEVVKLRGRAERERKDWEIRRKLQQEQMQKRLEALQKQLSTEGATWDQAMKSITKILRSFGVDFQSAGKSLGSAFGKAMRDAAGEAAGGASDIQVTTRQGAATVAAERRRDRAQRAEEARVRRIQEERERENEWRKSLGLPTFLARGGVVKAPLLAMLGETSASRPEVVAPESTIRGVFRQELSRMVSRPQPAAQPALAGAGLQGAVARRDVTVNQFFTESPDDPTSFLRQSEFAARTVFG
jgi:TP901 family phage tail tape measure protein